jgi:hypothetical protein
LKVAIAGVLAGLICCAPGKAFCGDAPAFRVLKLEGNLVHWAAGGQGQKREITYTMAAEDREFGGARNCRKITRLDSLLSGSQIDADRARQEIAAAFAMWEAVANISFREAADPARADIVIGAQLEPEGWAFADVFYVIQSRETVKPISRALICLNPARRWKVGFDGDLRAYDLRYTIAHEVGHAIGLDHPSGAGQVMGYRYEETFRDLQPGDIAGAVQLYGPRQADAVTSASAAPRPAERRPSPVGTRAFTANHPR